MGPCLNILCIVPLEKIYHCVFRELVFFERVTNDESIKRASIHVMVNFFYNYPGPDTVFKAEYSFKL